VLNNLFRFLFNLSLLHMNSATVQQVHVGEAGEALGVTPRYLKLLEANGAIPPAKRDARGFRVYSGEDLDRLKSLGVGSRPRRLKRAEEVLGAGG
jgi:MerR HTH family regulatory protein